MLVEGDAIWAVDDGERPQVQKEMPEYIQRGAVMIWASRAEPSNFWTRTIGSFDPPAKRQRLSGEGMEFLSMATSRNGRVTPRNGYCNRTFK